MEFLRTVFTKNFNIFNYLPFYNVQVAWLGIRPMQNKWASCSTEVHLNFKAELLDMGEGVWNYVIVHELLHFSMPNHGQLLKSLMPCILASMRLAKRRYKRVRI